VPCQLERQSEDELDAVLSQKKVRRVGRTKARAKLCAPVFLRIWVREEQRYEAKLDSLTIRQMKATRACIR